MQRLVQLLNDKQHFYYVFMRKNYQKIPFGHLVLVIAANIGIHRFLV